MVALPIEGIEELLGEITAFMLDLFDRIARSVSDAFNAVVNELKRIIDLVADSLVKIVEEIEGIVGDIFLKIQGFIETTITQILQFVDEVLSDVIAGISTLVDNAVNFIQSLTRDVVGFIEELVSDAADFFIRLFDDISTALSEIVDQVTTIFSDLFDTVVTNIESFVDDVKLFLGDLFNLVSQGVSAILAEGQEVVDSIERAITEFIDEVVNGVGGALRDLLDTISNLPGEIADLATRMVDSARENIGDPITGLPLKVIETIMETISGEPLADIDRSELNALNAIFGTSPVPRSPELFREGIERSMPSNPLLKGIVVAILTPLMLVQLMSGIASANSQIVLQEHALENPYRLLEPPDLARAAHFNALSREDAATDFRKHGFTQSDAEVMLRIAETIAPEAEQLVWWLRGISTDEEFVTALSAQGWSLESIEKLKLSAFFIPPVQDLITMAVREVFTPEIAERFGQFEDFPQAFVENALKQGVSEEWARNYWAAHWALPSVQMGFEMLHRRVITKEDLDLLLRATDVMPFWRDKLIAISFAPLTRVDIRRMHKLDVLSNDEVLSAYQDIGYNEANAQRLLDFTIQLNKPAEAQDDTDLSALTRTNIINLFEDGVLTRTDADQLLLDLGISRDAATLFLDASELELQRKERKDEIELILDQAQTGVLTFEEAQDNLNGLGLETLEIALALAELNKREARRTKQPSRGDLDKMFKAGLITDEEYLDNVRRLGFTTFWATKYLALIEG